MTSIQSTRHDYIDPFRMAGFPEDRRDVLLDEISGIFEVQRIMYPAPSTEAPSTEAAKDLKNVLRVAEKLVALIDALPPTLRVSVGAQYLGSHHYWRAMQR